jgi:toxin ParE1/3/4
VRNAILSAFMSQSMPSRPNAARAWYFGLKEDILTLRSTPGRCPVTPEAKGVRQLLYGHKPHIYRVIYRILETQKQVEVLHIRHGARDEFAPRDLG